MPVEGSAPLHRCRDFTGIGNVLLVDRKIIYLPAENTSRIFAVSPNINTFICVDFSRTTKAESAEKPLWGMKRDKAVRDGLAAVLYVFLLVKDGDQGPLWKGRVRLLNQEVAQSEQRTPQKWMEGFIPSK